MKILEKVNKEIIKWAIIRAGYELEQFLLTNPLVASWINGEKQPTIKQLEKFSLKVHVPFGYLFLNEQPKESIPIPFFRTGNRNAKAEQISLNTYNTIQILQERQIWLNEYLTKSNYDDLNFVGKYDINSRHTIIAEDIKKHLGLTAIWANKFNTWQEALDYITTQIERLGIIVTFNGIVGNNTHRALNTDECRGFVLVDKKIPFLFINSNDAKAAQMFTIIHELAHIWIGESAGFNNKEMLPANNPVELLCDQVAAEFLVPEKLLKDKWEDTINFRTLSKFFKVSQIVIARRAFDLQLITKNDFFDFYHNYIAQLKYKKDNIKTKGGNFYATVKKRISLRFAEYVNSAVNDNKLLYRDAYKLTSLKGDTYNIFMNQHLY